MRLFGQHESAGARQRVKARLREAFQLHLAIAVSEIGKHEERQPIRRLFVEGTQHPWRFVRTRRPAQQVICLFTTIFAEILEQQINHRPEVAAFLDIDLKEVAHVVKRRRGQAKEALLFYRPRLGIALNHDQALEHVAVLARHVVPYVFARMFTAGDLALLNLWREEHTPAVFRHADIVELGPTLGVHGDGGAQIDHGILEILRDQVIPPVDVARMPPLQRLEHLLVATQADVVWDLGIIADIDQI